MSFLTMTPEQLEAARQRSEARMAQAHGRVYPDCTWYRTPDQALNVEHPRHGVWGWWGCPAHCPTTSSGIPSDKMVEQARLALADAIGGGVALPVR